MEMTKQKMTSTVSFTANTNTLIAELGHDDVLLGRGTGPNEHEGNKRFRNMAKHILLLKLKETKRTNQSCSTAAVRLLSAKDKRIELAKKLVAKVHSKKGRFVRKLTKEEFQQVVVTFRNKKTRSSSSSFDSSTVKVLYVVVPENVAVGKAKQSFRHQLRLIAEGNVQDEDEEGNSVVLEDDDEDSEIGDHVTPPAGGSSSNKGSRASDEDSGAQRQEEESNFQPAADSISASSTTTSIPSSAGAARLPEGHFPGSLNYPPAPLPHDSSRAIAELSAYMRLPPYNNNNHNRLLNVPLPLMRLLMRTPRPAPLLGYNSSLFLPPPAVSTTASNSSALTVPAGRSYVPTRTNHFLRDSASSSSAGPISTRQQQQQRVLDPSYDDINNNNNANNVEGDVHHTISSSPPSPRDSSLVVPSSSTTTSTTTSRSSSSSGHRGERNGTGPTTRRSTMK